MQKLNLKFHIEKTALEPDYLYVKVEQKLSLTKYFLISFK